MPPPRGFYRSRALWDHVRQCKNHHASNTVQLNAQNANNNNNNRPIVDSYVNLYSKYLISLFNAIVYEIQPIRYSVLIVMLQSLYGTIIALWKDAIEQCQTTLPGRSQQMLCSTIPSVVYHYWKYILSIVLYYYTIRYIHETIHAGPVVLMITILIVIFTVGLDDTTKNSEYISAYSVFNKGFQRMMGTIDSDELLAQHVGGGAANMMMMGAGGMHPNNNNRNDNVNAEEEEDDARRRRRR